MLLGKWYLCKKTDHKYFPSPDYYLVGELMNMDDEDLYMFLGSDRKTFVAYPEDVICEVPTPVWDAAEREPVVFWDAAEL